jgi:hypothetical protein
MTDDPHVMRQAALLWGANAFLVDRLAYDATLIPLVKQRMSAAGFSGKAAVISCFQMSDERPAGPVTIVDI